MWHFRKLFENFLDYIWITLISNRSHQPLSAPNFMSSFLKYSTKFTFAAQAYVWVWIHPLEHSLLIKGHTLKKLSLPPQKPSTASSSSGSGRDLWAFPCSILENEPAWLGGQPTVSLVPEFLELFSWQCREEENRPSTHLGEDFTWSPGSRSHCTPTPIAPVSTDSSFTGGFIHCKKMQRIPVVNK